MLSSWRILSRDWLMGAGPGLIMNFWLVCDQLDWDSGPWMCPRHWMITEPASSPLNAVHCKQLRGLLKDKGLAVQMLDKRLKGLWKIKRINKALDHCFMNHEYNFEKWPGQESMNSILYWPWEMPVISYEQDVLVVAMTNIWPKYDQRMTLIFVMKYMKFWRYYPNRSPLFPL